MSKVKNSKSDSKINENHRTFVKNVANQDPSKKLEVREDRPKLSVKESNKESAYETEEIKKARKKKPNVEEKNAE